MNFQSGVVHEGLRLAFGPITRSNRVPMNVDLQYQDYTIPAGVSFLTLSLISHTFLLACMGYAGVGLLIVDYRPH